MFPNKAITRIFQDLMRSTRKNSFSILIPFLRYVNFYSAAACSFTSLLASADFCGNHRSK
jgi:hypothetical protein